MKSVRQRKKSLEEIYGSKFTVNNQKSLVQPVPNRNRDRDPIKIEHKCDKTGLLITLSTPPHQQHGVGQQQLHGHGVAGTRPMPGTHRGSVTYRVNQTTVNKTNITSLNKNATCLSSAKEVVGGTMTNHFMLNNLNALRGQALIDKIQRGDEFLDLEKVKRAKPKAKTLRGERRKANLEKLFQCINMESINEDVPLEAPISNQKTPKRVNSRAIQQPNVGKPPKSGLPSLEGGPFRQHQQLCHPGQQQQQRRALPEIEMDNETAEFVNYVRFAVEEGVQNAIGLALEKNYSQMATQMENFTLEVKKMHLLLRKVQEDLSKKIVHYGEETARHFRYLCMKSEYDKLFYQHNVMVAFGKTDPNTSGVNVNHKIPVNDVPNFESSNLSPHLKNLPNSPETQLSHNLSCTNGFPQGLPKCEDKGTGDAPTTFETNYMETQKSPTKTTTNNQNQGLEPPVPPLPKEDVFSHIESFCKRLKEKDDQLELCMKPPTGTLYNSEEIMIINKEVPEDEMESYASSEAFTPTSGCNMDKYVCQAMMATKNQYLIGSNNNAN